MSEQLPNALVGRIQNIPLTEDLRAGSLMLRAASACQYIIASILIKAQIILQSIRDNLGG